MNEEFVKDIKQYGFKENGILRGWLSLYVGKKWYLAYNPDGFFLTIKNPEESDMSEELHIQLNHVNNIVRVQALYFELTNKNLKRLS